MHRVFQKGDENWKNYNIYFVNFTVKIKPQKCVYPTYIPNIKMVNYNNLIDLLSTDWVIYQIHIISRVCIKEYWY